MSTHTDPIISSWITYHKNKLAELKPKYQRTLEDISILESVDPERLQVHVGIYAISDQTIFTTSIDGDGRQMSETKGVGTIQGIVTQAVKEFKSQFPHEYIEDFAVRVYCKIDNGTKHGLIMNLVREQVDDLIKFAQKELLGV
jgi:hypothetical protein